ncbi:hypothetical protein [Porphyromonas endodontalis]|jgi:hypothetical protein|nr:MAG TPA: hypothetical protein [Caudoviricetes sp.]
MDIREFDPVIYPFRLWVIVGGTDKEITDSFLQYEGEEIESLDKGISKSEAFAMPVISKESNRYGVVVYFVNRRVMTCSVIAHESSHAAKFLFEHIGADVKEHEPFEYVVGWIAGCCEKAKKNKE